MFAKLMSPSGSFLLFTLLLAARDVLSHYLLVNDVDPLFMLLVYCASATLFSYAFRVIRTGSFSFFSSFRRLSREQKKTFLKLGAATWVVYAVTILGIQSLGAAVFNAIDYGSMPIITLLLGFHMLNDRINARQLIGGAISLLGLGFFFFASMDSSLPVSSGWKVWIFLSLLSPLFSSLGLAYQKQQVSEGLKPDEVLLFRFPVATILMALWCLYARPKVSTAQLGPLMLIAFFGFFLPLWFLCQGFMRASLSRFSNYLFLIPIFTFLLGPIFVRRELETISNPWVIIGTIQVLFGYAIAEGMIFRRRRSSRAVAAH